VGETPYMRGSDKSTRALASIAVRNAMVDAGLKPSEIDGMLSYQFNDSVFNGVELPYLARRTSTLKPSYYPSNRCLRPLPPV
jgi:hypothetical protein